VLYYAPAQLAVLAGLRLDAAAILPPDDGFVAKSSVLQMLCTRCGASIGFASGYRRRS